MTSPCIYSASAFIMEGDIRGHDSGGTSLMDQLPHPGTESSLQGILKRSFMLYKQSGFAFTRVLILPVLQILAGIYGALALNFWYTHVMLENYGTLIGEHIWQWLGGLAVILTAALLLFKKGFLETTLLVASLNRNVLEVLQGKPPDFKTAYHNFAKTRWRAYTLLLSAYMLLLVPVILPLVLALPLAASAGDFASVVLFMGLLGTLVLGCLWLVSCVLLTFIFQIAAFEPLPLNPWPTFMQSARLVWRAPFRTLFLQVILLVLTSYILPWPVIMLLRLAHATVPLDMWHTWMLTTFMDNATLDVSMLDLLESNLPAVAALFTDSLVGMVVTMLLLPLGTFAFTLLYLHLGPNSEALAPNPKPGGGDSKPGEQVA